MSLRRALFLSSRRFGLNRRAPSCNYSSSSRHTHKEPAINRITTVKEEPTSTRRGYILPALLAGSFVGFASYLHYNDERRATLKGQGGCNQGNCNLGPVIGGPFTLIDTEQQAVTEKNFLGNWVLLYFGHTSSPDVGPEQVKVMAKTIDALESKHKVKVLPVFVTIDPQRDTPSHLRAYLKEFDPRIVGLTGPVNAIRQMAQEYRVYFRKVDENGDDYLVESSHNMYLLNPNMKVERCFGVEYGPSELSEAILKELSRNSSSP